jgi:DNA-binding phage protein
MSDIRQGLIVHGKRRQAARNKAKIESEIIRGLASIAIDAGLSKSEIARLAQITRPALDTMLHG